MSWVRIPARRMQDGSLLVLLFLLPFSIAAVEITFGLFLLGWLLDWLDPATRRESLWLRRSMRPLAIAVVGYLGVCALSIVVSDFPLKSLSGLIKKWVQYLLLFVMAVDAGARPGVVRRASMVLAWSSVFVLVEVVTQWRFGKGLFRGYPLSYYGRVTGPYQNPIDLATYLMVVLPVLLSFALTRRTWTRPLLWSLLVLLIVCVASTEALGAWIGLGVGLLVMLRSAALRRYALILLAGVVLAAGLFLQYHRHLAGALSLSDIGKVDRWMMWQAALGMIRDRPILGHGLNTFMANYLKYWVGGERMPRYAHNCYLQVAAETGLIGLAMFLWLLGALFTQLVSRLRRLKLDDAMTLSGLTAGLLAFAVQSGYDTNFYSLRQVVFFWVMAGLAVGFSEQAACDVAAPESSAQQPAARPPR